MEEKTNKKLSYEELSKAASDLHVQYQKLMREYQGAINALNNFDSTTFFLQSAFKVLEHPEMYTSEFVMMCSKKVEYILTKFADTMEVDKEGKGEAE